MSIPITDKFKPKGAGGYALIDAEDVEMPDGGRLSDVKIFNGEDGLTPYIGDNGNWWIGEEDTGVQAAGQNGAAGTEIVNITITEV